MARSHHRPSLLGVGFVRNREFMPALCPSAGEDSAAILAAHAGAEAVFIDALAFRGLIGALHLSFF